MSKGLMIRPEYVVNEKGKRKAVIIDYGKFEELLDDLEDLRDVAKRENEKSRLFSDYHRKRAKR